MIEQNKSKELPPILLGKHSFEIDLYDLSHIIIEGSEYSKRRVYLDSLIRQFLNKYSSNDLNMYFISFNDHNFNKFKMDSPIFYKEDGVRTIKYLVSEMDRRYNMFFEKGYRDIKTYNSNINENDKLPFLALIIDAEEETFQNNEIFYNVLKLVQKARGAGIYVIISIPSLNKELSTSNKNKLIANIPIKISFIAKDKNESRSIIGIHGNELINSDNEVLIDYFNKVSVLDFD